MDPDRAWPEDPPIDAMCFVEVIAERGRDLNSQLEAAREMLRPYALRALLDGRDPVEVGRACGFAVEEVESIEASPSSEFFGIFGGPPKTSARQKFEAWLNDYVDSLVAGDHIRS